MKNSGKDSGGFYRELASLVLPITVQNLMTALVSAADVVMAEILRFDLGSVFHRSGIFPTMADDDFYFRRTVDPGRNSIS